MEGHGEGARLDCHVERVMVERRGEGAMVEGRLKGVGV